LLIISAVLIAISANRAPSIATRSDPTAGGVVDTNSRPDWQRIPFVDVRTNQTVTLTDFAGKTVVVEVFTAWCEACLRQQQEAAVMLTKLGETAPVYISLNLDIAHPNDNAQTVADYAARHQFPWIFGISNKQFTEALIDQFGYNILNAPIVPIFVIGPTGTTSRLSTGLHNADELIALIRAESKAS
jgi:thiol-disulfide isomerase/thioredoxin